MTRQEHLDWCKERAMAYVNAGDNRQAFASMCSDVTKHDGTRHHRATNQLGMTLMLSGHLETKEQMTEWIQGYN